jgi:hypothetical protein
LLYAILAYYVEAETTSWTAAEDAALMTDLNQVHNRLTRQGQLGPAARLDATLKARTLRGPGTCVVLDGPFAETKEQLLSFYVVDCTSDDAAIDANPSAVYEIRPVSLFRPGKAIPMTDRGRPGVTQSGRAPRKLVAFSRGAVDAMLAGL